MKKDKHLISIFRPKIVMNGYEDMPIPTNIREVIMNERVKLAKDKIELASETETMWYISTASLNFPLSRSWTNIYINLFKNFLIKMNIELPDFVADIEELNEDEKSDLIKIREWIYKTGMKKK